MCFQARQKLFQAFNYVILYAYLLSHKVLPPVNVKNSTDIRHHQDFANILSAEIAGNRNLKILGTGPQIICFTTYCDQLNISFREQKNIQTTQV